MNYPESVIITGTFRTRMVWINGEHLSPEASQKIRNHSPDGFNWGYSGSGPSQLALAILLYCTDESSAQKFYQQFKFQYVASWKQASDFKVELNIKKIIDEYRTNFPSDKHTG